jgi:hypothetical protein
LENNVGPPNDVSWFINPMNTIVISTINHSYWSYLGSILLIFRTNSAIDPACSFATFIASRRL